MVAQPVEKVVNETGKLGFGIGQLSKPTPMWVTWIFRTEFVINKAFLIWVSASALVPDTHVKEIVLACSVIDGIVWGLGRFVGITKLDVEE